MKPSLLIKTHRGKIFIRRNEFDPLGAYILCFYDRFIRVWGKLSET